MLSFSNPNFKISIFELLEKSIDRTHVRTLYITHIPVQQFLAKKSYLHYVRFYFVRLV